MATNERFQRWQRIYLEQFTYTHNLILIISIAIIGFIFNILENQTSKENNYLLIIILIIGIINIIIGLFLAFNRLEDFRITMKVAKLGNTEEEDAEYRAKSDKLGRDSKRLLVAELILLGTMLCCFLLFVLCTYI